MSLRSANLSAKDNTSLLSTYGSYTLITLLTADLTDLIKATGDILVVIGLSFKLTLTLRIEKSLGTLIDPY